MRYCSHQHIEVPDGETDDSWLALEYLEDIYEETEAEHEAIVNKILGESERRRRRRTVRARISMINRIMKMGVKDRVKLAIERRPRGAKHPDSRSEPPCFAGSRKQSADQ